MNREDTTLAAVVKCANCDQPIYQRRRFGGETVVWVHDGPIDAAAVQSCPGAQLPALSPLESAIVAELAQAFFASLEAERQSDAA